MVAQASFQRGGEFLAHAGEPGMAEFGQPPRVALARHDRLQVKGWFPISPHQGPAARRSADDHRQPYAVSHLVASVIESGGLCEVAGA